jgi:hypothetical protein
VRHPLPSLLAVCFCLPLIGCKTARQKDDTVVVVAEPDPPSEPAPLVPAGPSDPPPERPSVMTEVLPPVRGGAKVLPAYRGAEPCQMALLGESPVAKACSQRGLRGAMDLMQTFVRRAKKEGFNYACADCHVDEDDYMHLTPRAEPEFRKLLFLARPED